MTVLNTEEFISVLLPAAGFLPKFSRLHDRHQQFNGARSIHFFADNAFNFTEGAKTHRHDVVDASGQFFNHAGAKHQFLANDFSVCGRFLHGGNKKLFCSHLFNSCNAGRMRCFPFRTIRKSSARRTDIM